MTRRAKPTSLKSGPSFRRGTPDSVVGYALFSKEFIIDVVRWRRRIQIEGSSNQGGIPTETRMNALLICSSVSGTQYRHRVRQLSSIFFICPGSRGSFHHMRSDRKTSLTTWGSRYLLSVVRKKLSRYQERGLPSG